MGTDVEALLGEEIVALAASTFMVVFTGVGLGREQARNRVDKELYRRYGKPRGSDAHHAYQAVILRIVLVWERAGVAARAVASGQLVLLPDGARLRHPAAVRASICRSIFCPPVDTRAAAVLAAH